MPQPLIEWKSIDGTNAIGVAVLLMLTLGTILAIYTGLVASRIFAFYERRLKSMVWLYQLPAEMDAGAKSPAELHWKLAQFCFPVAMEFKALGHDRASLIVARIAHQFIDRVQAAAGVLHIPGNTPVISFPIGPAAMQSLVAELHFVFDANLKQNLGALGSLQPNYWPLLTPWPFTNYILFRGEFVGLDVPRKSWWEVKRLEWRQYRMNLARSMNDRRAMLELQFAGRRSDCGACCENCKRVI